MWLTTKTDARMIQYGAASENRSVAGIIFSWNGSALSVCYPQVIIATLIAFFAV